MSRNFLSKIAIIIGARPNFVKAAPLINAFKKNPQLRPIIIHTSQHYDFLMSQIFFKELQIPKPDYCLNVGSGLPTWQTGQMLIKLEEIFLKTNPDLVMVIGDTTSTLAGALTAAKLHLPIAHVEAGLRSYNRQMPEEINRVLTDHLSDLLFCPTSTAVKNLKKEGITQGVHLVGDVMYDVFLKYRKIAAQKSRQNGGRAKILEKLNLTPKQYLLLTVHRAGTADELKILKNILRAVNKSKIKAIFPVHPRTRKQFNNGIIEQFSNIQFIEPVGYLDMLSLETNAQLILTDSGGVQKEAYWARVPCVTLRAETEWVETVKSGWNMLVGSDERKIRTAIKTFRSTRKPTNDCGTGRSAYKISQKIFFSTNVKTASQTAN
ncbi:MAG TPA: UDP-N-acetylglucosamine 2-epimerase (non-hydrolyzing) [Candidatus Jacksonbacteria bacterium]|nr:MAG: UDP-N-acetylglucosamine 2-epimerase [Parcubacteria group bacterium GW2011_GWC2_44_22]OGY74652.1 MAG: UDP-N-acetylglucosamine 2-epimerase [Candidatus Jacksonbacteria bacterium RIFOXYA2_FULL_43_12]OGY75355.1 MAG: UDP-N-acetylglucosamine 2-epimerase [Candidatus Jacksonbacteria bacterium RIFOXYB2_FULL_44_15]OGY82035.1 MAG: UDP-N-acetylglucosamine 2-epimerase [Candidatus Jacksonbacteria bacterium RIFOXYD2_FULL_43_21]HBH45860.1 UDP-N-acetylglucosamine 2-epimerase (non-hydrolyzing) [Candidatus